MDKSGGVGLNQPDIRQNVEDKEGIYRSDGNNKEGKFFNKDVKAYEAESKLAAIALENAEHPSHKNKAIGQDYNISHKAEIYDNVVKQAKKTSCDVNKTDKGICYFVDHSSKQQIIEKFRVNQEPLTTICISSLEDLEKHGLLQETWLEDGQLQRSDGRLFLEKPLTIIFDLTIMDPSDIASLNDMLQADPSCNGKRLGSQVKRVCLVNDEMIKGAQASNPDLWRRLVRMKQGESFNTKDTQNTLTDDEVLAQISTEAIPKGKKVLTIDFTLSNDWYQQLFGGISVDEKGKLVFYDGALANLPEGAHLVFKNAPWDSPDFKKAIATARREGCFEADHKYVQFPETITLSKKDISLAELEVMKKEKLQDNSAFNADDSYVFLNEVSIESLKNRSKVEGTKIVKSNVLESLIKGSKQLVVTNSLEDSQWLWLLTHLEHLPEDKQPKVFSNLQPKWVVPLFHRHWNVANDIESAAKDYITQGALKYEICANDSLESLRQVNLTSQNQFIFSEEDSPLLKNLINGEPVILSGLEKNPKFSASLETLLLQEPYLFIGGHKIDMCQARVTFIKPEGGKTTGSSLMDQAFTQYPKKVQPSENPVYALLKSLPRSLGKKYPDMPPWNEHVFQKQFEEQAELECELDNLDEDKLAANAKVMPYHKRRAMHILLAKAYRGDANVYGYIKAKIAQIYPDTPEEQRGDSAALRQWLLKHPNPDPNVIKTHFWELAQHCPVKVHKSIENFDKIDRSLVKRVMAYLVAVASDSTDQPAWAESFNFSNKMINQQSFFVGTLRSTLRDVLVANKLLLEPGILISDAIAVLENDIEQILQGTESDEEKSDQIKNRLGEVFKNRQLPQHYKDVPEALLTHKRHSYAQQERRLVRLAQAVLKHPVVFLQGESGAGKTFMAQAIAEKSGYPECQVIQLGPNYTADDLFGGSKIITRTENGVTDQSTQFEEGPLLKWAQLKNPPLLVLDEANLAPEGLLAPLAGLTKKPPEICYQGRVYQLSDKHRIILTGNPDHYEGRHLDTTLTSCVPTFFYHPLPESVLANSIIKPGLPEYWSDERKQQACECLLVLFNQFQTLIPEDLTTPRDLKDVLATLRQILSHHSSKDTLSERQINALMHRAFIDSLTGAVTETQKKHFGALNIWYQQQFPEDDSVLKGVNKAFGQFLKQLKLQNSDANFTPLPIQKLVYRYWQNLEKDDGGRVAAIVEGPAGWGKDFILNKVIKQWQEDQLQRPPKMPLVNNYVDPNPKIQSNPNQRLVDGVRAAMNQNQQIAFPFRQMAYRYLQSLNKASITGTDALINYSFNKDGNVMLEKVIQLWPTNEKISQQQLKRGQEEELEQELELKQEQQQKQLKIKDSVTSFVHINANLNQWAILVDTVKNAMNNGQVIAISELNLIPSSYLEGLFNNVLTGHAKPGFRLFATVNSSSCVGREAMSPGLKSRCTQIKLEKLSIQQLNEMVEELADIPKKLNSWLAHHFYQLSTELYIQKSPVQLTLDELSSSAVCLAEKPNDEWGSAFKEHLSLAFYSLKTPLQRLQINPERISEQTKQEARRLECERIVNSVKGQPFPITINLGNNTQYHNNEITLPHNIAQEDILTTVQHLYDKNKNKQHRTFKAAINKKPVEYHKNGLQVTFKDILNERHFYVENYFPKELYDLKNYRLEIFEFVSSKNKGLYKYPINLQGSEGDEDSYIENIESLPWKTDIKGDEIPGKVSVFLREQWQPLPGISHCDVLKGIQVTPAVKFELARSKTTGQLLIRTLSRLPRQVVIDFIIVPDKKYFKGVAVGEKPLIQEDLCTESLYELLHDKVLCNNDNSSKSFDQLRVIDGIEDVSTRLKALLSWLNTFSDTKNISGVGEELVLNIIQEKQGVCRHRAMIFQLFCHYWGIPARFVESDNHALNEISFDGGVTWRFIEMSGGGLYSETLKKSNWDEYPILAPENLEQYASNLIDGWNTNTTPAREKLKKVILELSNVVGANGTVTEEMINKIEQSMDIIIKETEENPSIGAFTSNYSALFLLPKFVVCISHNQEWLERLNKFIRIAQLNLSNKSHLNLTNAALYRAIGGTEIPLYAMDWCYAYGVDNPYTCTIPRYSPQDYIIQADNYHEISQQSHHNYINWICDLCDINEYIKDMLIGNLQRRAEGLTNFPCTDRILKMVHEHRVPEIEVKKIDMEVSENDKVCYDLWVKKFSEMNERFKQHVAHNASYKKNENIESKKSKYLKLDKKPKVNTDLQFFLTLPKSKHLKTLSSKKKLVKKYSTAPKENSKLVWENLASGSPAFLNQTTMNEYKTVVIDMCYLCQKFESQIDDYIKREIIGKKRIPELCDVDEESYNLIRLDYIRPIQTAFLTWLGQQQIGSNKTWGWLMNDYKTNYEQIEETQESEYYRKAFFSKLTPRECGSRLPVELTSDQIRKHIKDPSALVIKEDDLCIMLGEFLKVL